MTPTSPTQLLQHLRLTTFDIMTNRKPLIYLASPYSHPDPEERERRFILVCRKCSELMASGLLIFSPIAHTHPVAVYGALPLHFDYWAEYDRRMIEVCDELAVLMIDGWKQSRGVIAELEIAKFLGKPISYLEL